MRISIRDDDSGYKNYNPDLLYTVYADGIKAPNCFTLDQELGFAICYKTDKSGMPFVDKIRQEFEDVVIKGVITFKTKPQVK